ncbi:hypothetical protein [Ferrimonas balearica]|uniref:hypothetical protein n=1 Tax=Ferrimonas balearica TaxID=44012 RepID=UPI001FEDA155|nr:hypothetical protein [Ferrimonas balearica]
MKYAPIIIVAAALSGCSDPQAEKNETWDPTLCQFQQGECTRNGATLAVTPFSAPSEEPLTFHLTLPDDQKLVASRIEGRDMFMGVIPVRFDEQGNAEVIYGSCSSGYMVWRLFVTTEDVKGEQHHHLFDWLADAPTE